MPKPTINFERYLKRVPTQSVGLPQESEVPCYHYRRSANDAWNLLLYIERNLAEVSVYRASYDRHMTRLATMVLLSLIEAFERFLKEVAAECINHVAPCTIDDRLDIFSAKGANIAAHFSEDNLGKALCESLTWCDCKTTNERFRRVLSDPFTPGDFHVFPRANQNPLALRNRYELMNVVWQLRHTIAHNMGVVTPSDALKFRLLTRAAVDSPRLLWPTKGDVWYVKLFLDEMVDLINREVGLRLAALLTSLHQDDPSLFAANIKAQEVANLFRLQCAVDAQVATPT